MLNFECWNTKFWRSKRINLLVTIFSDFENHNSISFLVLKILLPGFETQENQRSGNGNAPTAFNKKQLTLPRSWKGCFRPRIGWSRETTPIAKSRRNQAEVLRIQNEEMTEIIPSILLFRKLQAYLQFIFYVINMHTSGE